MKSACLCAIVLTFLGSISGCATPWQTAALTATGIALMAQAPTTELEQTYYLGMFDPQEQVPSAVYRVTVHGQASFLSGTRFASGWLPAELVDSLTSHIDLPVSDPNAPFKILPAERSASVAISPERRMMVFGPEGFRESPANNRLVIVMGSSPQAFFDGAGEALAISSNPNISFTDQLTAAMTEAKGRLESDRQQSKSIAQSLPAPQSTEVPR